MRNVVLSATIVVVVSLSGTADSTIWHVHPDSAVSSIQAGIESSSHGDTVLVYPGTYVENVDFNGKNIVLGSLFLMTGDTSHISSTIIDGDSSGAVVTVENGEDSTAVTTGFTIQNGYAEYGGGIYCDSSSPNLSNVILTGNTAGYGGGGICCYYSSDPSLTNVNIHGNTANYGGGICCRHNSNPRLTNVTINGNTVYYGGGIHCYYSSDPSLTNVTISGNTAYSYGGGICCSDNANPSLTNVTISGNNTNYGGGICCRHNSNPSLVNCILWNDAPEEVYFDSLYEPNAITISYSDIQGDSAGIVTNDNGTVYWLEGNIDLDPLFVGSGEHPFSLQENSPCIDAGRPDTAGLNLPPWDIIGNHRIWDGDENGSIIIDIGAYEYGAPPYVGINDKVIAEPKTRTFLQNCPNPFSPRTTIRYGLSNESKVTLKVYNALGQEVRVLVDKLQGAGARSVVWDSRDNVGRKVSCGTYFLRLEAHTGLGTREYTATRKLSVMR